MRFRKVKTMMVNCPECLQIRTINRTDRNVRVRCKIREGGCGARYYTKNNIVLSIRKIYVKQSYFAKKKRIKNYE